MELNTLKARTGSYSLSPRNSVPARNCFPTEANRSSILNVRHDYVGVQEESELTLVMSVNCVGRQHETAGGKRQRIRIHCTCPPLSRRGAAAVIWIQVGNSGAEQPRRRYVRDGRMRLALL